MTKHAYTIPFTVLMTLTLATVLVSAHQIRRQTSGPALVPIEMSLKAAGEGFEMKNQGSCTQAPKASIHGILSEMWTVRQEQDGRSVQLTLWKPADGSAPMFSLSTNGKKSMTISTVRGGQVSGSGTVTLAPSAKGGTFTVDAKSQAGEPVSGTIKCEAFTPAIAEGGNE